MKSNRREFIKAGALGAAALSQLFGNDGKDRRPHFAPRARRIVYLFQSGGPSQIDLYDYKPQLNKEHGKQLPDHVRCRRMFCRSRRGRNGRKWPRAKSFG